MISNYTDVERGKGKGEYSRGLTGKGKEHLQAGCGTSLKRVWVQPMDGAGFVVFPEPEQGVLSFLFHLSLNTNGAQGVRQFPGMTDR